MNRRWMLGAAVAVCALTGVLLGAVPFVRSLGPTRNAGEALLAIDASAYAPGTAGIVEYGPPPSPLERALVIRGYDGVLHTYWLPIKNNLVMLPDLIWGRWGRLCHDFGPDMDGANLVKNGLIRCHDVDDKRGWPTDEEARWTYDGKSLGRMTENMKELKQYRVQGKYVMVGL